MKVTDNLDSEIITYALGSCIGLAIYDIRAGVGGLIHYMLPDSKLNPEKARANPYMFADVGIPMFFHSLFRLGATKRNLVVKAAGGANLLDPTDRFNIGKRNHLILRKLLWKNNLMIDSEDIGGSTNRALKINIQTGQIMVKPGGGEFREL